MKLHGLVVGKLQVHVNVASCEVVLSETLVMMAGVADLAIRTLQV